MIPAIRYFLIIVAAWAGLSLAGCAGTRNNSSTISDAKPIWSYGNHCGGNYPSISLDAPPVDDIDLACYFHDKCYALNQKPSKLCDDFFFENITRFIDAHKREGSNPKCMGLTIEIQHYILNNGLTTQDSILGKAVMAITLPFRSGASALVYGPISLYQHEKYLDPKPCRITKGRPRYIAPTTREEALEISRCDQKFISARISDINRCMRLPYKTDWK